MLTHLRSVKLKSETRVCNVSKKTRLSRLKIAKSTR